MRAGESAAKRLPVRLMSWVGFGIELVFLAVGVWTGDVEYLVVFGVGLVLVPIGYVIAVRRERRGERWMAEVDARQPRPRQD